MAKSLFAVFEALIAQLEESEVNAKLADGTQEAVIARLAD